MKKLTEEVEDNLSYIMGSGIGLAVLQVSTNYIGRNIAIQSEYFIEN